MIVSTAQLRSQPIWFNSLIRIENKLVYFKLWATNGIQTISDLATNDGTFFSFPDFKERYKIKPTFLSFMGIISPVKQLWNKFKSDTPREDSNYDNFRSIFFKANKPTKVVYQNCERNIGVDWKAVYQNPFHCTKISKLLEFQFKLIHRRLSTNSFLKKINLIDNDLYSFCQKEQETLIHLFWNCTVTFVFWQEFENWLLKEKPTLMFDLSPSFVLGLKPQVFKTKHHYFLLTVVRFYIWTSSKKRPMLRGRLSLFPLTLQPLHS